MVELKQPSLEDYDVSANSSHSLPKLSSEEKGQISEEDWISNLPQPLIHHILSKLPLEDSMRTMVLSKAWKDEWLTSPCLDLTDERRIYRETDDAQLRNQYLDFALRILTRRNDLNCSSIERLNLFLPPETRGTCSEKQVDNLLCYAVTKFVIHELKLSSNFEPKYGLSKDIFQHTHSLTILALECLEVDQQTITTLAVKCPLLKSLELEYCDFIDLKIRVSGFHKLVYLSVICTTSKGDDVKVEIINAPSLETFRFLSLHWSHASHEKNPSIDVISDSACRGLKHMDLTNVCFDRSSLNRVLSHLPNLQFLKLVCHFLSHQRLDICSPSLKHFELTLQDFLGQLHIDAPNLAYFVYTFRALNAMPIIFPFNANSFKPEKVTINIDSGRKKVMNLLQDVEFSRFLKQLDGVSQHLLVRMSIFYPDFSDRCLWPPEPATSQDLYTTLLDPALCASPNLQTCIILQRNIKREPMELKFEFKYKGSEVHGCWQQRLSDVNIENIRNSEMYISPLRTLFEEAIKAK